MLPNLVSLNQKPIVGIFKKGYKGLDTEKISVTN